LRIHLRDSRGGESTRVVLGVDRHGVLEVEGHGIRAEGTDARQPSRLIPGSEEERPDRLVFPCDVGS
jgi:hypothetical protein